MSTSAHRRLVPGLLCLGLLSACTESEFALTSFEGPTDAAVMPPGDIFEVAVGFVANSRSGDITKLDLTHQGWLADGAAGSFYRGRPLATGRTRYLEHVAVTSSDDAYVPPGSGTFVTLFASDAARQELLIVPYLDDAAEAPEGAECLTDGGSLLPFQPVCWWPDGTWTSAEGEVSPAVALTPSEGSTAVAALTEVGLVDGRTTTETWTATWSEAFQRFDVVGELSGVQEIGAEVDVPWTSRNSALSFTIHLEAGALSDGDHFTVRTTNGIQALPVPGVIQDLVVDTDAGLLYLTTEAADGAEGAAGHFLVGDLSALRTAGAGAGLLDVPLPPGATPTRMDLVYGYAWQGGADRVLFFADPSEAGVFHQLDVSGGVPETFADRWQVVPVGFPSVDLALSRSTRAPRLYLGAKRVEGGGAADSSGVVRIYDVEAGAEIDFNPYTPYVSAAQCRETFCPNACVEACVWEPTDPATCQADCEATCEDGCRDEGVPVNGPITGLSATVGAVELASTDNEGRPLWDHLIAVTTYAGSLYTIAGSTGCLTFLDPRGAYVSASELVDEGETTNINLWLDPETSRTGVGNQCGGITRAETWSFRYDALVSAFRVEGTKSGPQVGLAFLDRRYVSDGGEVSILLRSGTLAPTDGDIFLVQMEDNVSAFSSFELPQDPVTYELATGSSGAGWSVEGVRQGAVVLSVTNDTVTNLSLAPVEINTATLGEFQ